MSTANIKNNQTTTLKSIAALTRAIVLTHKPPCKLREILAEYREYDNKALPFRNLGYDSAEQLLKETGEFVFNSIGTEIYISAKPNPKSYHIASLVRDQKKSKNVRSGPVKEVRKPSISIVNRNNNNNNFNYNNYYKAQQQQQQYRQQQTYSQKPQSETQKKSQPQSQQSQQKQQPPQNQNNKQQQSQLQSNKQQKSNTDNKKQQKDLRDVLNAKVKHQQVSMAAEVKTPRPILGQNNNSTQQTQPQKQKQTQTQVEVVNTLPKPQQQQIQQKKSLPTSTANVSTSYSNTSTSGIQNRLRLTAQANSNSRTAVANNMTTGNSGGGGLNARLKDVMQKTYGGHNISTSFHQNTVKMNPIGALIQYTLERGLPEPIFSSLKSKYSSQYQCRVEVNGSIYSTYPNEYTTEPSARIACAQKAIEQILQEQARRPLPICMDTDKQLIAKIYDEMMSKCPCGVFADNLPEWYESIFKESLPSHWWSLLTTSNKFTVEKGASNAVIVLANTKCDKDEIANTIQMDPIKLPWEQRFWDIYVTYCESTVEIWARLIGEQYNQRFDQLLSDIEKYMEVEKSRPVSIACKNMYLVFQSEIWHRVRVEEVNKVEGKALCFYIDFGDVNWLAVDQLYICEPRFLQLPAQAVAFSLFGLEDFGDNPYARQHLDKLLTGKSLVGEVLTKEADFAGKMQVFLYDTNSTKDVELNPLLLEEICNNTAPPELDVKNLESVLVTHVNNDGDVFLQLMNDPGWKYVQKLTQQLIESKFKHDQHQVSREELWHSKKLFLICDEPSGRSGNGTTKDDSINIISGDKTKTVSWYRGVLSNSNYTSPYNQSGNVNLTQEEFDIYYVDFGETRRISLANIFRLDQLSAALSKYPAQAIRVRLHDIPDITPSIVGRMRALLPPRCEAMAKRRSSTTVYIYRRFDTLCLINEAIRIEHELSVSSTLDDSDKDMLKLTAKSVDSTNGNNSISISGGSTPTTPTVGKPFIDLTRGLTVLTDSPQKTNEIPKLKEYHSIPRIDDFFEVRVTMSANPLNFMIQPYKDYPSLRILMKELQEYCETNDEFIPVDMVELGQAYAAKNPDGFYHRVTVVDKYINDMIHIYYCDFGDIAILSNAQLKTLPARFRQLPKMALQAKLYGIAPRNGDWTLDDCLRFRELTVGLKFVATIKKISYDTFTSPKTQILEMELIDVTTEEDVFIHEQLLKENRAIKMEY